MAAEFDAEKQEIAARVFSSEVQDAQREAERTARVLARAVTEYNLAQHKADFLEAEQQRRIRANAYGPWTEIDGVARVTRKGE